VIKGKVDAKNAFAIKHGKKIVDKEAEVYERMIMLPEISRE
jgi:hypothetical protein